MPQAQPMQTLVYSMARRRFLSEAAGLPFHLPETGAAVLIARASLADAAGCALLAPEERERGHRYARGADRRLHAVTHFLKRAACAEFLDCRAEDLAFISDANGKPRLAGQHAALHFNLTHSGLWAGAAFSRTAPLGLDIQHPVPLADFPLSLVIHPRDAVQVRDAVSAGLVWAVKEAVTKESGSGLSQALPEIVLERSDVPDMVRAVLPDRVTHVRHRSLADKSSLALAAERRVLENLRLYEVTGIV